MSLKDESFRRQPKQGRSELRLEQLLDAAAATMTTYGVPSTTMAMIAEAAGASIGTIYQYFPDKASVIQALRNRFGAAMESRLADLETRSAELSWHAVAEALVQITCQFAEEHPAYFHVFGATVEGQRDQHAKYNLRMQLGSVLRAKQPSIPKQRALEIAEVCTQVIKGMPDLYLPAGSKRRRVIAIDYVSMLEAYFTQRL